MIKSKLKYLILLKLIIISFNSYSNTEEVEIVTVGSGINLEEAIKNALRSGIEQAYGVFISSNTKILNDQLLNDEIITVSSGNIKRYDVIAQSNIGNETISVTVKSVLSINQLSNFIENKGGNIEFKGDLFSQNIKQTKLNEKSELIALTNMAIAVKEIVEKSFDYNLDIKEPLYTPQKPYGDKTNKEFYFIPMEIRVSKNKNFDILVKYIENTLMGLSMKKNDVLSYIQLEKFVFPISFINNQKDLNYFILRNNESIDILNFLIESLNAQALTFKVYDGLNSQGFSPIEKVFNGDGRNGRWITQYLTEFKNGYTRNLFSDFVDNTIGSYLDKDYQRFYYFNKSDIIYTEKKQLKFYEDPRLEDWKILGNGNYKFNEEYLKNALLLNYQNVLWHFKDGDKSQVLDYQRRPALKPILPFIINFNKQSSNLYFTKDFNFGYSIDELSDVSQFRVGK